MAFSTKNKKDTKKGHVTFNEDMTCDMVRVSIPEEQNEEGGQMKIQDVIQEELPSSRNELKIFFKNFPKDAEVFIKRVSPGEYVIEEGAPCYNIYCILKGKAAAQYYLGNNSFVAKNFGRLSVMGDIAALGNLKFYSTSIQAITTCKVLEIRVSDYWNWLFSDHGFLKNQLEIAFGILLEEAHKKRALEENVSEMRLLSYFSIYCRKAGFNENGLQDVIIVKKTREQIAEEVGGISVRTVNRKILSLTGKGLIAIVHGKIQISLAQFQKIEAVIKEVFGDM